MRGRRPDAAQDRLLPVRLALGLGAFLPLFDMTAVLVAMPGIARDLGFDIAAVAWAIDAYSLAFIGASLASGALADRYGRRRSISAGNAVFLIASIACGMATSGAMLLAARTAQGIGAAFLVMGASTLIASACPSIDRQARARGAIRLASGVAMALGPALGGLLTSRLGWPWVFYANIPFCLALALAVPRLPAEVNGPARRPLDPVSVVLLPLSLGLLVNALLGRGSIAITTFCLIGGAVAALVFGLQQLRSARPLFDLRLFATPAMAGLGALLIAIQCGYWAVLAYLPLFLHTGLLPGMDMVGLALLAATLPLLLAPLIGGHLVAQRGWRRSLAVAFGLIALGNMGLVTAALLSDPVTRLALTLVGMVMIGLGAAMANRQISRVVLALVPPGRTAMASTVTGIAQQAGLVIGVAALGATLGTGTTAAAFAAPFALAGVSALAAIIVALVSLSAKKHRETQRLS